MSLLFVSIIEVSHCRFSGKNTACWLSLFFLCGWYVCSSFLVCNLPLIVPLVVRLGNAIRSESGVADSPERYETFPLGSSYGGSKDYRFWSKTRGTLRFAHTVGTVICVDLETVTDHDSSHRPVGWNVLGGDL